MPCTICKTQSTRISDYYSDNIYTWCTNCGNYGIHAAVKRALVAENIHPHNTLLCFDIGCNGNGSDKIDGYRFHGLHGRILPFAAGAAVTNSRVKVLAFGGDGGTFGEGVGHLIHTIRGNYNITFIFHNNSNYGLTTGQASPTTYPGMKMNSSPDGITSEMLHPMRLVLALNPTFAARSFSGDVKHMTHIIQQGLQHPGFSFIEILQSCPTFNKTTPHEWYQQRVYDVQEKVENYDPHNIIWAREVAEDINDRIAVGVLYQRPDSIPQIKNQPNRQQISTELVDEVKNYPIEELVAKFR
jgi:2-oxoglutarate ferredoxin oxidoreductase subunit beta